MHTRHAIIGTSGHVDHGKTSLTRALTGVDTDRLREEKERGLSIEIGFAPLGLPDGRIAGVVDVPGHERFVRNMVAGASGIDLVLLVIAADEGMMPQTWEHLHIVDLLGVRAGIIVLTKADLVDDEWLELVEADVASALASTGLAGAPMVRVSSQTGQGVEALRVLIASRLETLEQRDTQSPFRMPIDRVFTIRGFGTVVTGTLSRGVVSVGDEAEVWPGSRRSRVRQVQVHGRETECAYAGQRVAANLPELQVAQLRRGDVLAAPGSLVESSMLDVRLRLLQSSGPGLRSWQRVRVHIGAAEILARAVLLEDAELRPGGDALAQLRLESPTAALVGDRFILRTYSPVTTFGGGVVLDPSPLRHRGTRKQEAASRLRAAERGEPGAALALAIQACHGEPFEQEQIVREAGLGAEAGEDAVRAALEAGSIAPLPGTPFFVATSDLIRTVEAVRRALADYAAERPLRLGMEKRVLRTTVQAAPEALYRAALGTLIDAGEVSDRAGLLTLAARPPEPRPEEREALECVISAAREAGLYGLSQTSVSEALGKRAAWAADTVHHLVGTGQLTRVGDRLVVTELVEQAKRLVCEHFRTHETLTVAQFRDLTRASRRPAVLILEHLDAIGLMVRDGDERRLGGGPRSPVAPPSSR